MRGLRWKPDLRAFVTSGMKARDARTKRRKGVPAGERAKPQPKALFRAGRAEIRPLSPLEAGGGEQDLQHACPGSLVSDEMSIIADRRIRAAGGTCAIH